MNIEENYYIVAVGASAGGLEAIESLFSNIPADCGISFVLVQHLSPDYKSLMVELLSKKTNLKVIRAENEMRLEKNCIYLIPPKKNMTVYHRHLILSEQDHSHGLNLPIDIFFKSLAHDVTEKAVGVILSGTGSDGTSGLKEIKEHGGLMIVQEPESAQFDGMPKSAINTGLVDFVLPPIEIAEKLVAYVNSPQLSISEKANLLNANQDGLLRIFSLIRDQHKIDYSFYKLSTMVRRIERRMSLNQIGDMQEYIRYLESNQKEVSTLYKELLIGVTNFFRDPEAFTIMEKSIIPELISKNENHEIRIWVAGCSTGEEAYSVAILCHEYLEKTGFKSDVKIFATDVDPEAIIKASNGIYNDSIVNDISENLLSKYFIKESYGFKVSRTIREMVVFAKHNLVKDPPFPNIDLITCRNLLIYLQPSLQKKVFDYFNFSLVKNGVLFLGSSESIGDYSEFFETINHKWKIYKSLGRSSILDVSKLIVPRNVTRVGGNESYRNHKIHQAQEEERVLTRFLDSVQGKYLPLSIVFNERGDLLHTIGDASKFLKFPSGKITNSVRKLIKKELEIPVSTAIQKLFIKNEEIIYHNIKINVDNKIDIYNLKFILLQGKKHQESLGAIFFEHVKEVNESETIYDPNNIIDISEQVEQRISDLEQELQFTKENLQATIEELETSNEELQAANEELLASNEELQSTNEELQSVNEELHTVNSEHQSKIIELTVLNNDIENMISTLGLAVVFFDDNLELRKYTPKAHEILKLNESDLGKSFENILYKWEKPNLCGLIEQVQYTGESLSSKLSYENRYYIAGIDPYLISHDAQSGVTLTLVDVSELHGMEKKHIKDQEWLAHTALLAKVGGWEIDLNDKTTYWTDAVYEIHDLEKPFEHNLTNGINFYADEDQPKIQAAISECIETGKEFDINLRLISSKKITKNVRVLGKAERKNGKITRVFGVIQDISEMVKIKETAERLENYNSELKDEIKKSKKGIAYTNKTKNK